MANVVYTPFLTAVLTATAPDLSDSAVNVKVVLVDAGAYTFNATHNWLSDIPSGARIATSGNLQNKSVTAGVFDADDISIASVSGASFEYLVLYHDTGTAGTSRLIVRIDTATVLPATPAGTAVNITWANDARKIFRLVSA